VQADFTSRPNIAEIYMYNSLHNKPKYLFDYKDLQNLFTLNMPL